MGAGGGIVGEPKGQVDRANCLWDVKFCERLPIREGQYDTVGNNTQVSCATAIMLMFEQCDVAGCNSEDKKSLCCWALLGGGPWTDRWRPYGATVTTSFGQMYGLVGRNRLGKTSFCGQWLPIRRNSTSPSSSWYHAEVCVAWYCRVFKQW